MTLNADGRIVGTLAVVGALAGTYLAGLGFAALASFVGRHRIRGGQVEHRPAIYICGPITGRERDAWQRFSDAEYRLRKAGYEPVNPLRMCEPGMDRASALRIDIPVICEGVEGLAMLEDWHDSLGCRTEFEVARAIRIPVLRLEQWEERHGR